MCNCKCLSGMKDSKHAAIKGQHQKHGKAVKCVSQQTQPVTLHSHNQQACMKVGYKRQSHDPFNFNFYSLLSRTMTHNLDV